MASSISSSQWDIVGKFGTLTNPSQGKEIWTTITLREIYQKKLEAILPSNVDLTVLSKMISVYWGSYYGKDQSAFTPEFYLELIGTCFAYSGYDLEFEKKGSINCNATVVLESLQYGTAPSVLAGTASSQAEMEETIKGLRVLKDKIAGQNPDLLSAKKLVKITLFSALQIVRFVVKKKETYATYTHKNKDINGKVLGHSLKIAGPSKQFVDHLENIFTDTSPEMKTAMALAVSTKKVDKSEEASGLLTASCLIVISLLGMGVLSWGDRAAKTLKLSPDVLLKKLAFGSMAISVGRFVDFVCSPHANDLTSYYARYFSDRYFSEYSTQNNPMFCATCAWVVTGVGENSTYNNVISLKDNQFKIEAHHTAKLLLSEVAVGEGPALTTEAKEMQEKLRKVMNMEAPTTSKKPPTTGGLDL